MSALRILLFAVLKIKSLNDQSFYDYFRKIYKKTAEFGSVVIYENK